MPKASLRRRTSVAFLVFAFLWCSWGTEALGQDVTPPKADHHAHLFSPVTGQILRRAIVRGAKKQDAVKQDPLIKTASDLIVVLDEAGIKQAVALSGAFLFGAPGEEQIPPGSDEYRNVRNENNWLLEQVKPYSSRLVGFCSTNPLKSYAIEEIKRCASIGLKGLKLQLANSDVNLRDPGHLQQLKLVFSAANAVKFPIIVHMRTRSPVYGLDDARNFIEQVMPSAPEVVVQICHMAGWGGFDSATDAAMGAFIQAFASGVLARKNVYFDISATAVPLPNSGVPRTAELVSRIRQIGLNHVLFGTDWPTPGSVGYQKQLRQSLGLESSELQEIFNNAAPYLKQ